MKLQEHKARQEQYNFRPRRPPRFSGERDRRHEETWQKAEERRLGTFPPDVTVIITVMCDTAKACVSFPCARSGQVRLRELGLPSGEPRESP